MLNLASIFTALPSAAPSAGAAVPDWVMLIPAGTIQARDGRGPWRVDPAAVVAATQAAQTGTDIVIDYEHQSVRAEKNGQPAPAGGWITELAARADGVWGKVEWTARAAGLIDGREYRYLSPAFLDDGGRVTRLVSVGLVSSPALDMPALAAQDLAASPSNTHTEPSMDPNLSAVAAVLGLPAATPPDAIVSKVRDLAGQHAALCSTHGLPVTASAAELVTAAQQVTAAARAPDPARFVPIEALNTANQELSALRADKLKAEAETLVTAAQAAGKVAPAMAAWAKDYAAKDPQGFAAWAAAAPAIVTASQAAAGGGGASAVPPAANPANPANPAALSEQELMLCSQMGLTAEAFAKAKAEPVTAGGGL